MNSLKNFKESTYLSQVRRLRRLAVEVLKHYPIKKYELKFINHGENATFKIVTNKQSYLLRIHRHDYHTKKAILEELRWLNSLSKNTDIPIQKPLISNSGELLTKVYIPEVGQSRYCDVLLWQEGQIKYKKQPQNFFDIGVLTAKLQKNTITSIHRKYWDAKGLLGEYPTFGSLSAIKKEFPKEYKVLEPIRKKIYLKLKKYELDNPKKLSVIHADLHFGNMLWHKGIIHPIDFDDCGYGFQMYDLAVILNASTMYFSRIGDVAAAQAKDALLMGYNTHLDLSNQDLDILPDLVLSRDICMIGWLYQRRDNPMLLEHLRKELPNKIKRIKMNV
ncbi:MAG: phosphotransferase [Bdellovibrionaceae bacterium]|nr:phosphotransferase [Pseudobdellovibrionaceae bacterium]